MNEVATSVTSDGQFSLRLVIALLHFVWQGALVGGVLVLVDRLLASRSAAARYLTFCVAILCLPVILLATFLVSEIPLGPSQASDLARATEPSSNVAPLPTVEAGHHQAKHHNALEPNGMPERPAPKQSQRTVLQDDNLAPSPSYPTADVASASAPTSAPATRPFLVRAAPWLAAIYLIGACLFLLRLCNALWSGDRLRGASVGLKDSKLLSVIADQCREMEFRWPPTVAYCQTVAVPTVIGIVRPIILLPATLMTGLTANQFAAIISHELAHIRRHDLLMNLLQRIVESILFFHPAVWFISRRMRELREVCCDDRVLKSGFGKLQYADALLTMAEKCAVPATGAFSVAMTGEASNLESRIQRLMGVNRDTPRLSRGGASLFVALIVGTLFLTGVIRTWAQSQPEVPVAGDTQPAIEEQPAAKSSTRDIHGDLLPKGAVARLGSIRYHHPVYRGSHVSFLPGRHQLVMATSDGVGIWDAKSGLQVREILLGAPRMTAYDVSNDGQLIVTVGAVLDRSIRKFRTKLRVVDLNSGKEQLAIDWLDGVRSTTGVRFSPQGSHVATRGRRGWVRVWDLTSRKEVAARKLMKGSLDAVDFSPDGKEIVAVGRSGLIWWDWTTGKEPLTSPLPGGARCVVYSPDGDSLATGSYTENGIRVWDVATRSQRWRINAGRGRYYPIRLAFTADSGRLVIPGRVVDFRDTKTGKQTFTLPSSGVGSAVAISTDQTLLCHRVATKFEVFDVNSGKAFHEKHPGSGPDPLHLRFTSDGGRLVVGGITGRMTVWDVPTAKILHRQEHDGLNAIVALAVSPNDEHVVTSGFDQTVRLWNLKSGKQVYRLIGHSELGVLRTNSVAFHSDSQRIVSFGNDLSLRTWDIKTGKALSDLRVVADGTQFNEDGAIINAPTYENAVVNRDGRFLVFNTGIELQLVNTSTGKVAVRKDVKGEIEEVLFSDDGKVLLTTEVSRTPAANGKQNRQCELKIRDPQTLEVRTAIKLPKEFFHGGTLADDGSLVAVRLFDRVDGQLVNYEVAIFDSRSGNQIARIPRCNARRMRFSPDRKKLATSHEDTSILIWDLDQFRLPL